MSDANQSAQALKQQHVFISHATTDDDFVRELRVKLELSGVKLWVDSRNLAAGNKLEPNIERAILDSGHVIAVLSPRTINSPWVRKEIQFAEANGHEVIPLLLPGIEPSGLGMWFDEEPFGVTIALEPGQLDEAMAAILAALGRRLPDDPVSEIEVEQQPVAELLLELTEPTLARDENGSERLAARAELTYVPADEDTDREVKSRVFRFVAPVGQIEQDDLRWYLEKYYHWPVGLFQQRAQAIEQRFPLWGQALFEAALGQPACQEVLAAWRAVQLNSPSPQPLSPNGARGFQLRFSVQVDASTLDEGDEAQARANEAASRLQSLPWELLHDDAYLSAGANPARIRRRLPNFKQQLSSTTELPIRVLLLSPRPEEDGVGYIDHRASALPLVDAVEALGDLVQLTVLSPPTYGALEQALHAARDCGQSFDVVHFDGHGVYDSQHGLGALCFENPNDASALSERRNALVYADKLGALIKDFRIPLVFLEACQTAQTADDPNASVAAKLLEEGVTSVVAMSHSVLVETARRFVTVFYQALAQGQRVGAAMLLGQKELMNNTYRLPVPGAGDLHLQDWFVPVLYQERTDPVLFKRLPSARAQRMRAQQRQALLGDLPETPAHTFIGRSRELLALERLLERQPYAVVRGQGGAGKTTIAVELARWLVRSRRFERCAFVSVEDYSHDRAVLDVLGKQLVGDSYSVAEYGDDLDTALLPLLREIENYRCLIVVDNLESLLGDDVSENLDGVFNLLQKLLTPSPQPLFLTGRGALSGGTAKLPSPSGRGAGDEGASLLFTTREPLPKPFNHKNREITLGALSQTDARALVLQVMNSEGLDLRHDDLGNDPAEVNALVDAVGCHARALVLLARELAVKGVSATTANVREVMVDLERRHPGARELSLFASVELSLRHLAPDVRDDIAGLAVFHDGADMAAMAHVLGVDVDRVRTLGMDLIQVGLAQTVGDYGYVRFDPALSAYLALGLDEVALAAYRERWLAVMGELVGFLYQQSFQDAKLSAQLTQLELPNLMAYLQGLVAGLAAGQVAAEPVVNQLGGVEQLLANLNQAQALAQVVAWREQAAQGLGEWSHSSYQNQEQNIDRLLQQGDLQGAYQAAEALLQQCQQVGGQAYVGADYDLAMAHILLGQVLRTGGAAEAALAYLQEAQQRFEALGESGARMSSVALTEQGDCLQALGQLEAAAGVYKENIDRAEKLEDIRQVAVGKGQLASVRYFQKSYADALSGHQEALVLFEQLGEPGMMATAWHQMGMVHKQAGNFGQAEQAYRQSLSIKSQQGNRAGEASSLNELGNLYGAWNRPEQAVSFYRQAVDIAVEVGDKYKEGLRRNNLADTLIKLKRYDDTRLELLRAIECDQAFGHVAEPWKTWMNLHNLEQASGNPQAARKARQKAVSVYLAYRRDGGENHSGFGRLALAVGQAIQQRDTGEVEQVIANALANPEQDNKDFLRKLQAIIGGERDLALAEDEGLNYELAVELVLLLEGLEEG